MDATLNPKRNLLGRVEDWFVRRRFGALLDPSRAAGHQPQVLHTLAVMEIGVARWGRLDQTLKSLATTAAAVMLNCSWCLDFGFWESHLKGVDAHKLREVPNWHTSDAFTDLERQVMAYAESMTTLPVEVTDQQVADLRAELGDAAMVELTALIAIENQRSRTNLALGLTSQGFKETCELPETHGT